MTFIAHFGAVFAGAFCACLSTALLVGVIAWAWPWLYERRDYLAVYALGIFAISFILALAVCIIQSIIAKVRL